MEQIPQLIKVGYNNKYATCHWSVADKPYSD